MAIVNATPDSFSDGGKIGTPSDAALAALEAIADGADIIDVGACSTRPGSSPVAEAEEMRRLEEGLEVLRSVAPETVVSVDTFRAGVARRCVESFGVQIVNDVYGGDADEAMFPTVAELGVPYVLMHYEPPKDDLLTEMLQFFAHRVARLHALGVSDIILDPGFGFGKTLPENYLLMRRLSDLCVMDLPILVGVSRKRMVYQLLGTTPQKALNGTTVLHTLALAGGASILRVHDVRQAVETVKITQHVCSNLE